MIAEWLPTFIAAIVSLGGLFLNWAARRDGVRQDEFSRLKELVGIMRAETQEDKQRIKELERSLDEERNLRLDLEERMAKLAWQNERLIAALLDAGLEPDKVVAVSALETPPPPAKKRDWKGFL